MTVQITENCCRFRFSITDRELWFRNRSDRFTQNLCDPVKFILTIKALFHLLPEYPLSHYLIYIKLLIQIFLLPLRQDVPQWCYRSLKLFFILNLQPNINTFYAHHLTPYKINELFHSALPWEYDAYVSSTRRTISVSSTRSHAACLYYHTHSHKRLTQTYPFSCRIAPSDSLNIINFHKHIYILSSSQLCATLFKYIPLVTFLRTNKLTPEIR